MEEIVRSHVPRLQQLGIANVSVVVAETASKQVRAYVGSQDFNDPDAFGQVDGAAAPHSTGSILKPLLFAAAIDVGLLVPSSLLEDAPVAYGAFTPSNADLQFRGLVTAERALVESLNVPAVALLADFGVPRFHHLLSDAGLTTLVRPPSDYGLTLILGGAEAKLLEVG